MFGEKEKWEREEQDTCRIRQWSRLERRHRQRRHGRSIPTGGDYRILCPNWSNSPNACEIRIADGIANLAQLSRPSDLCSCRRRGPSRRPDVAPCRADFTCDQTFPDSSYLDTPQWPRQWHRHPLGELSPDCLHFRPRYDGLSSPQQHQQQRTPKYTMSSALEVVRLAYHSSQHCARIHLPRTSKSH